MQDTDLGTHAPPSSAASLLGDALAHPWRKWGWFLLVASCGSLLVWLVSLLSMGGNLGGRIIFVIAALIAVIVRCYFSVIETTLTGYGDEPGHGSGLRMDEFWETLGRVIVAALLAWCPVGIAAIVLTSKEMSLEPWLTILSALGCEYFPMALLGIVNFGGMHGAMPQVVMPGIFKCGPSYMFAGLGLLLIPYSAVWAYGAIPQGGAVAVIASSCMASYFLVVHARLVGQIYMTNRERLGWE